MAFRRPSAFFRPKKSLKQPSGQNNLAAAKKNFVVLPHDSYVGAFLLKTYHFLSKVIKFEIEISSNEFIKGQDSFPKCQNSFLNGQISIPLFGIIDHW